MDNILDISLLLSCPPHSRLVTAELCSDSCDTLWHWSTRDTGHGSCGANGAGNVANCDFPRITICQIYSTLERANKNQTFEDLDISAATQEPAGVRLRVRHRSRHWMLGFASTLWLAWYQLLSVCSSNTDCSTQTGGVMKCKNKSLLLSSEPPSKSCQNLVTRVQRRKIF